MPHVQHDYFSSFNQSDHCFLASSLPLVSSLLKLPNGLFCRLDESAIEVFREHSYHWLLYCYCAVRMLAPYRWKSCWQHQTSGDNEIYHWDREKGKYFSILANSLETKFWGEWCAVVSRFSAAWFYFSSIHLRLPAFIVNYNQSRYLIVTQLDQLLSYSE